MEKEIRISYDMNATDTYHEIISLLDDLSIKYEVIEGDDMIITYQKPKCEFCKNWKLGRCSISKYGTDLMKSGCGLHTKKNFGCILFENE